MRRLLTFAAALSLATAAAASLPLLRPVPLHAQAKESVFVNLTSDEPQRVTMAINFATKLLDGRHAVTISLNVDGVRIASTKVPALAEQRAALAAFMKAGGAVVVCPHCMQVRGVAAADLMPGLTMGGEGATMQAFLASTRSISY